VRARVQLVRAKTSSEFPALGRILPQAEGRLFERGVVRGRLLRRLDAGEPVFDGRVLDRVIDRVGGRVDRLRANRAGMTKEKPETPEEKVEREIAAQSADVAVKQSRERAATHPESSVADVAVLR